MDRYFPYRVHHKCTQSNKWTCFSIFIAHHVPRTKCTLPSKYSHITRGRSSPRLRPSVIKTPPPAGAAVAAQLNAPYRRAKKLLCVLRIGMPLLLVLLLLTLIALRCRQDGTVFLFHFLDVRLYLVYHVPYLFHLWKFRNSIRTKVLPTVLYRL